MRRFGFALVALAGLFATPALAQSTYPTPSGTRVQGVVPLYCDASGLNCAPAGTSSTATEKVEGNVASGATDAGNPVKIGCIANTGIPTATTTGKRINAWCSGNGGIVTPGSLTFAPGDALANSGSAPLVTAGYQVPAVVFSEVFNGTTWDRQRGDTTGTYVVEMPSAIAAAGTTIAATSAAAGSLVAKASAGNLYGYNVVAGASAGYVLVFNATSAPADGAVTPARCIPLAANAGVEIDLRGQPTYFSSGITIVFSTTGCFTKTASATAFIAADAK